MNANNGLGSGVVASKEVEGRAAPVFGGPPSCGPGRRLTGDWLMGLSVFPGKRGGHGDTRDQEGGEGNQERPREDGSGSTGPGGWTVDAPALGHHRANGQ